MIDNGTSTAIVTKDVLEVDKILFGDQQKDNMGDVNLCWGSRRQSLSRPTLLSNICEHDKSQPQARSSALVVELVV
jgi:hypothetical protein